MAKEQRSLKDTPKDKIAEFVGDKKGWITTGGNHTKVTLYITPEQILALEDIRRKRLKAGAKLSEIDKSKLMREAIGLLIKQEGI